MSVTVDALLDEVRIESLRLFDEKIHEYPLVLHPVFFIAVVVFYVLTLTLGPKLMAKRQPFELRMPMMVYNVIQIAFNTWFLFWYFGMVGLRGLDVLSQVCLPVLHINNYNLDIMPTIAQGMVFYYINKVLDLTETVFFVLRKKQSQISTLHVFHHLSMVISVYVSLVYAPDEISVVMGALNAAIHLIMYIYYFLAGFGSGIQKYLWWKKYLTRMQMVQFLIMLSCLFKMALDRCKTYPLFWFIWVGNVSTFFALFFQFYSKSYRKTK